MTASPDLAEPLNLLAASKGGFFTRADALGSGWTDRELASARKAGVVERVRHGAYAFTDTFAELDDVSRHLVAARAVVAQQRGAVALTGISAAAAHGLALWGQDLSTVHVVRLDSGSARVECGVRHHVVADDLTDTITTVAGVAATDLARTVWEVSCMSTLESGVCTADSALNLCPEVGEELRRAALRFTHRPGSRTARMILRFADGKAASPGESLSRVLFYRNGIPYPQLQHPVHHADGTIIGVADFYWEELRHLGEFDGKVKYGRFLRPGEEPGDAVFREKRREDDMRGEQFGMTRWIWPDLMPYGQKAFIARLHADLDRAQQLVSRHTIIA